MAREKTLKNLQKALGMELSAAHQYQLHAHVLDDWGIDRLAAKMREEFQEELEHSNLYMERIMFLKGDPEMRFEKPPMRAQSLSDMFETDLADEKEAITFYEVLESFRGYSLLEMKPKTGRTHQIRVHLAYIKHPIVADDMYGGKLVYPWQLADTEPAVQEPLLGRVGLHAFSLEFKHPTTEKTVRFEAPLPQDMQRLLDALREHRKN